MRLLLAGLALLGTACAVGAQDAGELAPGTRLRVTVLRPVREVRTGELRALTDNTLLLAAGASTHTIPLDAIERLEASAGRRPNLVAGGAGLLLGAVAGGLLGCAANRDSYGVFCGGQSDTKIAVGAALGGAAGGALGVLVFRRERWRALEPPRPGRR